MEKEVTDFIDKMDNAFKFESGSIAAILVKKKDLSSLRDMLKEYLKLKNANDNSSTMEKQIKELMSKMVYAWKHESSNLAAININKKHFAGVKELLEKWVLLKGLK